MNYLLLFRKLDILLLQKNTLFVEMDRTVKFDIFSLWRKDVTTRMIKA